MKKRQIFITAFDKKRLDELIDVARAFRGKPRRDLDDLASELKRAMVVDPSQVPVDVVTMNSKVLIHDVDTAKEVTYELVFPNAANVDTGAISVLAPVGTAILGYRVGEIVEWPVPSGNRRIRIEKLIYQPEAAGHFDR